MYCIVYLFTSTRHQLEKTSGDDDDDDDDDDDQCMRVTYRRSCSIFIFISCILLYPCFPSCQSILHDEISFTVTIERRLGSSDWIKSLFTSPHHQVDKR